MSKKQVKERRHHEARALHRISENAKSHTHVNRSINYTAGMKDSAVRNEIKKSFRNTAPIRVAAGCENCAHRVCCDVDALPGSAYCQALKRCNIPVSNALDNILDKLNKEEYA